MNRRLLPLAVTCLVFMHTNALAQSQDVPKFEIAAEFATLEREGFGEQRKEPGAGARWSSTLHEESSHALTSVTQSFISDAEL